jgi:plasmid maintenance system antidote protein VapI
MTDNLQKPQCPISKLKRKSQSILKKEKQSKINRKSLETKLKKEESITNIGINKIRLLINRTKIDDENILFGYYCSSELLVDL